MPNKKEKKMTWIQVRTEESFASKLKTKAKKEARTLSAVIRRLLEKWLRDEISLD